MPTLKFEIEGMKSSILNHLGVVGSDLGLSLDKEITNAVENFPWQSRVDEIVSEAINSQLKSYFQYGEGADAIKLCINQAITNAIT